jgi:hypothetical protein
MKRGVRSDHLLVRPVLHGLSGYCVSIVVIQRGNILISSA